MRKYVFIAALLITVILLSILAYCYFHKISRSARYENIEIFDISKESVVKTLPSNAAIQKEVEKYLKGITNLYVKFNPIPSKGTMVKIPLSPPVNIKNQWINAPSDQVILIFPEQGEPYLMVFYSGGSPLFFNFQGETKTLLKYLNFKP